MRNMKLFWLVIRRCHFERFLLIFVISFFLVAIIIRFHEPGINDFGDAMWYTFVSCTTIGFGDFTVTKRTFFHGMYAQAQLEAAGHS